MSLLLLLACSVFSEDATPSDLPDRGGDTSGDQGGDTSTEEAASGSVVHVETTDIRFTSDQDELAVTIPTGGTLVRVESCTDDGRMECDVWDGGYRLYDDGEFVLTPSAWDGEIARVTWLVIE